MFSNESAWISFFMGAALKSIVVLCAAWLTAFVLRRRSAAARHIVWTAASVALLALPLLSLALPGLSVDVPAVTVPTFQTTALASPDAAPSHTQTHSSLSIPAQSHPWHPDWRLSLMVLWIAGTAVCLLRMAMAWISIGRLRRASNRFRVSDLPALAGAIGLRDEIDVFETAPGTMPMSFGLRRPAIALPADAAGWDHERRRMVLLHELAHVQRGDFSSNLLARAALSLYWWNPLAWIAWREFLKEQERATDDLVLNAGAPPTEYAGHLLEIARTMQTTPAIATAAVAMARRSQLEGRLLAILDSGVNRKTTRRASTWLAAGLAIMLAAPLAALRGQNSGPQLPADIDNLIRSAVAQKNHEILENAAKAAEALQKYDIAQKLLESSLSVRADVSGQESAEYGMGLLKLADLARHRGQTAEARDFYSKAAAALGNRPQAAPALIYLGVAQLKAKDPAQAFDYFERAKLADPSKSGAALMWMAVARQHQGNVDEADALYRQSLGVQDPNTPEAATVMRVYAQFLEQQGREDESKSMRDRAVAFSKSQAAKASAIKKASAGSDVYKIGNGVSAPTLDYKIEPQYSEEAKAAKLHGTEVVYAEIGPDGVPRNLAVLNGVGLGLDEMGIAAINQWRFKPAMKDGQPVTVGVTIEINFRLL